MTLEQMIREWDGLPPQAKQQVADFIAFLREQHGVPKPDSKKELVKLEDESYVGMWQDRDEMTDSSGWVCATRTQEWDG